MTIMQSDTAVLTSKIEEMREDIRRLLPILSLLEPLDRDQMSSFAERLLSFMAEIDTNYREQTAEFAGLRAEFSQTRSEMQSINEKLGFLIDGT